jgi:hypothetical protein
VAGRTSTQRSRTRAVREVRRKRWIARRWVSRAARLLGRPQRGWPRSGPARLKVRATGCSLRSSQPAPEPHGHVQRQREEHKRAGQLQRRASFSVGVVIHQLNSVIRCAQASPSVICRSGCLRRDAHTGGRPLLLSRACGAGPGSGAQKPVSSWGGCRMLRNIAEISPARPLARLGDRALAVGSPGYEPSGPVDRPQRGWAMVRPRAGPEVEIPLRPCPRGRAARLVSGAPGAGRATS